MNNFYAFLTGVCLNRFQGGNLNRQKGGIFDRIAGVIFLRHSGVCLAVFSNYAQKRF